MGYSEKTFQSANPQGFHHIVYNDWGEPNGKPIICVHGLTGNGHDFDYLAEDLITRGYRLICVDLAGRSRSDFLSDPMDYNYDQYFKDLEALMAHLNLSEPNSVDWIGISLGGLLGIYLASLPGSPIKRLILNDVGPDVPKSALDFIYQVISKEYHFNSVDELEQRMRETRGLTWGSMTDEQWGHMAKHNARPLDNGQITYGYDPQIAEVFKHEPIGTIDLWPSWEKISCPTLLIRGQHSVVLPTDIVDRMREKGPDFDFIEFENCGHVPSLMAPDQIEAIASWLNTTQTSS